MKERSSAHKRFNKPINATEVRSPVVKKTRKKTTNSRRIDKKLTKHTDIADYDNLHPKFDAGTDFKAGPERAHHHKMMNEHHARLEHAYTKLADKHAALADKHNNAYGKHSSKK